LKEIKQTLDIREGRLGDTNFRFIDYYELLELLSGDETITITVLPGAHNHPHNDLSTIQGGNATERYHLTLAEHTALGAIPDHNDLGSIQGGSPTERYHLTLAESGALHPPDKIFEGDSRLEIVDTGTGIIYGYADNNEVLRLYNLGGRIGKINEARIDFSNAGAGSMSMRAINTLKSISLDSYSIRIGDAVDLQTWGKTQLLIDCGISPLMRFSIGNGAGGSVILMDIDSTSVNLPVGLLETNTVTPIDLTIDCGTEKTVKLAEGVWKDINVGGAQLNPIPAFAPDLEKFADEGGGDTGIYTLAFAVGESASGSFEIQHDYKEGTDISFHIHWQGKAAPTGTDNVQWQLTYTIARFDATLDAATVIVIETPIDTQYKMNTSVFPMISGSTGGNNGGPIQMGDQFLLTVERIAAAGDAYSGDALVMTAGLHYEVDTMGSRQIGDK